MNADMNTVRLLGAAQVMVIVCFFITEGLFASVVGSGSISDILVNISQNLNRVRISNLVSLGQTLVIIVMGVLYYVVFYKEYKIIALVALVCFLVAAITLTVTKIGTNALIPLGIAQECVLSNQKLELDNSAYIEGGCNIKQSNHPVGVVAAVVARLRGCKVIIQQA